MDRAPARRASRRRSSTPPQRYLAEGTPLIVLAGKEYGSGSSRDWAAKGPILLGVRAVIAESYERIHRSNLLMMGILPLQFRAGESRETLGLTGREEFAIDGIENGEAREVTVRADDSEFTRARAARHAARARVPPPRRDPAVRPAATRELGGLGAFLGELRLVVGESLSKLLPDLLAASELLGEGVLLFRFIRALQEVENAIELPADVE